MDDVPAEVYYRPLLLLARVSHGPDVVNRVLYFPHFETPRNAWLSRVVLYWDGIGSIVPRRLEVRRSFNPYTRQLVDAGLLVAVHPEEHLWKPAAVPFDEAFLEHIQRRLVADNALRTRFQDGYVMRMRVEKVTMGLAAGLEDLGIAREAGFPFYEVESSIALAYMAHLAGFLGGQLDMVPMTDQLNALQAIDVPNPEAVARRSQLRMELLAATLPGPTIPPPVSELVDFKERHTATLQAFRHRLEADAIDLAAISDQTLRQARKELLLAEYRQTLEEIKEKMNERGWRRLDFGSFCQLVSAGVTGATASLALDPFSGLGAFAGVLAFAHGIARAKTTPTAAPLAYAALASRQFSV